jgi:hypothetical protein
MIFFSIQKSMKVKPLSVGKIPPKEESRLKEAESNQ